MNRITSSFGIHATTLMVLAYAATTLAMLPLGVNLSPFPAASAEETPAVNGRSTHRLPCPRGNGFGRHQVNHPTVCF